MSDVCISLSILLFNSPSQGDRRPMTWSFIFTFIIGTSTEHTGATSNREKGGVNESRVLAFCREKKLMMNAWISWWGNDSTERRWSSIESVKSGRKNTTKKKWAPGDRNSFAYIHSVLFVCTAACVDLSSWREIFIYPGKAASTRLCFYFILSLSLSICFTCILRNICCSFIQRNQFIDKYHWR